MDNLVSGMNVPVAASGGPPGVVELVRLACGWVNYLFVLSACILKVFFSRPGVLVLVVGVFYAWKFLVASVWLLTDTLILAKPQFMWLMGFLDASPPPPPIQTWNDWVCDSWYFLLVIAGFVVLVYVVVYRIVRAVPAANHVVWGGFQCERVMEGSLFIPSRMPSFMFLIEGKTGPSYQRLGVGYKSVHGLTTAAHVIEGVDTLRLTNAIGVSVECPATNFVPLEHLDVVRCQNVVFCSSLCLTQAKESRVAMMDTTRQMVMVHNGSLSSMGVLTPMDSFGNVQYSGSTTKGFSGSPYYFGNTVFGMHLASTNVNFGYEADYMRLFTVREESSEEFMLERIKKGGAYQWEFNPGDPDEVFVKVKGRYVALDRSEFFRANEERDEEIEDRVNMYDDFAMAFDEGERKVKRKKTAGHRILRPSQLEGGLDVTDVPSDQGNLWGPAVPAMQAAGRTNLAARNIVIDPSMPTILKTKLGSAKSMSSEVRESIPVQKNSASPSMSRTMPELHQTDGMSDLESLNAELKRTHLVMTELAQARNRLREKSKKLSLR